MVLVACCENILSSLHNYRFKESFVINFFFLKILFICEIVSWVLLILGLACFIWILVFILSVWSFRFLFTDFILFFAFFLDDRNIAVHFTVGRFDSALLRLDEFTLLIDLGRSNMHNEI